MAARTKPTQKLDLYKEHKDQYAATKKPALVNIKRASYLTISGKGAPGGDTFTVKIGALYGVAFTIKMAQKAAGCDYAVCKLEALWWGKKKTGDFSREPKDQWNWKFLIRTPDFIKKKHLNEAVDSLLEKGKGSEVKEVAIEALRQGKCVQMLHVGPYDQEHETIAQMMAFSEENRLRFCGEHHEIYLSDPRRVAPERLRTILRVPVATKGRASASA